MKSRARLALPLAACLLCGSGPIEAPREDADAGRIRALIEDGRFAEAESAAREHLARVEAAAGDRSLEAGLAVELLVEILRRSGRAQDPEAARLAERAVAIVEQAAGPSDPALAHTLVGLAGVRRASSDLAGARRALERALPIAEQAHGRDHPEVARVLYALGLVLMDLAAPDAREILQRSLEIQEKALGADDPEVVSSLGALGILHRNHGDFETAVRLHRRELALREKGLRPDHPDIAVTLENLGEALHRGGDLLGAERAYRRAIGIWEATSAPNPFRHSEVLNSLADLYDDMGDRRRAGPLHEEALSMRVRGMGDDHPYTAMLHMSYGNFLLAEGDLRGAGQHLARARAVLERTKPGHPVVGMALENLGNLRMKEGSLREAGDLYRQALAIWESIPDYPRPARGDILVGLARIARESGDPQEAERLLERAVRIRDEAYGPTHPILGETLIEWARLDLTRGRLAEALERSLAGQAVIRGHLERTARGLSEREALVYEAAGRSGLDVAISALAASAGAAATPAVTAAWDGVIRSRALVLDEMAARHRSVLGPGASDLAPLVAARDAAVRDLGRLVMTGPQGPGYVERLERARGGCEQAERALAQRAAALGRPAPAPPPGLEQVKAGLDRRAALVAYVLYARVDAGRAGHPPSRRYAAFAQGPAGATPAFLDLGPAAEIDALIERFSAEARNEPADLAAVERCRRAGDELRARIWDPLRAATAEARTVLIVPDGALHAVSFDALPASGGKYLLEVEPPIAYLSAERDLAAEGGAQGEGEGLLLLGGVDFDAAPPRLPGAASGVRARHGARGPEVPRAAPAFTGQTSTCEAFRALRFADLPGSSREIDEVERLWKRAGPRGPVVRLDGGRATEESLKSGAPGRSVLHLATHGFLVAQPCGGAGDAVRPAVAPDAAGALLLSGLALAGANRREDAAREGLGEDGVLTAEEIASLDLSSLRLAVLSACESGAGAVQAGEGVLGLRRALRIAGAGSLVVSLWPVGDLDARIWMRSFYSEWLHGGAAAESVRRASLAALAAQRRQGLAPHPFSWGGFIAVDGGSRAAAAGAIPVASNPPVRPRPPRP